MKTPALLLAISASTVGCATLPPDTVYLRSNESGCSTQKAEISGKAATLNWCVYRRFLQPNLHKVKLDGVEIFSDTDFKTIDFSAPSSFGEVRGVCVSTASVIDMKTQTLVAVKELPRRVVEACAIEATPEGLAKPFVRTDQCNAVYFDELYPIIGKVFPKDIERSCTLRRGTEALFKIKIGLL